METPRHMLMQELCWQISICRGTEKEHPATTKNDQGIISLENQGEGYVRQLRALRDALQTGRDDHAAFLLSHEKDLLWKILMFFKPKFCFIDPAYVKERLTAFIDVVERRDALIGPQFDHPLWAHPDVKAWLSSPDPKFTQLDVEMNMSTRRFAIDLIDYVRKSHPVVHILDGLPPSTTTDPSPSNLGIQGVYEQLTAQCLQHVAVQNPLGFLLETAHLFKDREDVYSHRELFRLVCENVPYVSIVLDRTLLPNTAAGMNLWQEGLRNFAPGFRAQAKQALLRAIVIGPKDSLPIPRIGRWDQDGNDPIPYPGANSIPERGRPDIRLRFRRLPGRSKRTESELPTSDPELTKEALDLHRSHSVDPLGESSQHQNPAKHQDYQQFDPPSGGTCDSSAASIAGSWNGSTAMQKDRTYVTGLPLPEIRSSANSPGIHYKVFKSADKLQSREQIKIVIVCALILEADAIHALFDEHWDVTNPTQMRSPGDTNSYSFGVICGHPVVLVHMPGMGKSNASSVATNCRNSFPNVKLALVVGVCGAVPFYGDGTEIVLGDVIISEGLVPYDFGRRYTDKLIRREVLAKPPPEIRGLLNKMKGWMGRPRLKARMSAHLRTLHETFGVGATYLGTDEDHLFEATYLHKHNKPGSCDICSLPGSVCSNARPATCESLGCNQERLIHRKRHESNELSPTTFIPEVHFGQIGCGDQVMKSGDHRDCIAKDEDVIAFEMEGAGVWDKFPCIVIKGVCDYSDSHKNKNWQVYAACTSAACAKGLLQEWFL